MRLATDQCDQKKIAKYLKKLPKNDFTRKMIDFNFFTKLPKNVGDLLPKALKSFPKFNKSPNLVALLLMIINAFEARLLSYLIDGVLI